MCYSVQIQADYRKFVRMFGATMTIREFARLFFERAEGSRTKLPKAMEAAFADPQADAEREIKAAIDRFNADETAPLEQDLFKHRARLAEAERSLEDKATKKATQSRRIASEKIEWTLGPSRRYPPHCIATARLAHLTGPLRARDGDGKRSAGRQADAIPVPYRRQTCLV